MKKQTIAIGSDHAAINEKQAVIEFLKSKSVIVIDEGAYDSNSVDYPDYALKVCKSVNDKKADLGILICGTGIGMSMAANKIKGIRCALVGDTFSARMTKEHNNANVLALGARVLGLGLMLDIVDIFVSTEYSNDPRHQKRVDKVMGLEK